MFKYNLLNIPSFKVDKNIIDKIFSEINTTVPETQFGTINIIVTTDEEIKRLNNYYRKIDKVTDVLSFHYYDSFEGIENEEIAGEILMCENLIVLQGNEFKHGPEKEFYKLLIHSILHILGYDHESDSEYNIMKNIEDNIWKII